MSRLRRQPQWRLIVESVECYLRDLPADERRALDAMLGRRSRSTRARIARPKPAG